MSTLNQVAMSAAQVRAAAKSASGAANTAQKKHGAASASIELSAGLALSAGITEENISTAREALNAFFAGYKLQKETGESVADNTARSRKAAAQLIRNGLKNAGFEFKSKKNGLHTFAVITNKKKAAPKKTEGEVAAGTESIAETSGKVTEPAEFTPHGAATVLRAALSKGPEFLLAMQKEVGTAGDDLTKAMQATIAAMIATQKASSQAKPAPVSKPAKRAKKGTLGAKIGQAKKTGTNG